MTDYQVAKEFFDRIKSKGFAVRYEDFEGVDISDSDYNPDFGCSIELCTGFEHKNSTGEFFSIDFHGDGSFYRISGYTDGFWADEVDCTKY